jgi:hypothetical protein
MSIRMAPPTGRLRNDIRVAQFARDFAEIAAPLFAQHNWTWGDQSGPYVPSRKKIVGLVLELMDSLDAQPAAITQLKQGRICISRTQDGIWNVVLEAEECHLLLPEYSPPEGPVLRGGAVCN